MGKVNRFDICMQHFDSATGPFVMHSDYARLERERDQAMAAHADMVREVDASQDEMARLRALEAAAESALRMLNRRNEEIARQILAEACGVGAPPVREMQQRLPQEDETMSEIIDAVAIVICEACGDRPSHVGDAGGNAFRWQDYRPIAEKSIAAICAAKDREIADLRKTIEDCSRYNRDASLKFKQELDEARACVERLYPLASAHVDQLEHDVVQPMTALRYDRMMAELDSARAALANTPECLRK